jgi:hypothetical protein
VEDREWEVEVLPLVAGQRSVWEKEWKDSLNIFGINSKVGKKIIHRLGITLLSLFVTFLFLKEEQPSLSSKVTW